ncbi:unnamed protein product [Urochloa decumbens]|uniref:TF-B3 domain-containing protein n=2 Tax=Urochloa decumbens TaxID=240449 RepID=A0ABC9DAG5_9POAL
MAPPANNGAAARKHLRVLLPFSYDSLRIPDELAAEMGAGEALVVVPFGKGKVLRVEVGRDGDGAFLGRGWPEFAAACGAGAGWFLVFRHHGGGVLTVKVFDASCCLRELGSPRPASAAGAAICSNDASRRPQFISLLSPDSLENMVIPAKFVQRYISKEHLSNHRAVVSGPLGKFCQIEVEMTQSDVFFAGGWSQFVAFHGISGANSLLLRYEGNMVFTVKVFGPNGCRGESIYKDIKIQQNIEKQQEASSASIQRRKSKNDWPSSGEQKKPKASLLRCSVYGIGPPSWIKKVINTHALEKHLSLAIAFCDAIGLRESYMITLKTSMNSTRSWQVRGLPGRTASFLLLRGWKRFCRDNNLKEGDICTFNVIKTKLWHVVIMRYKEKINQCYETPESKNNILSREGQKRSKGSMTSLNKASSLTRCAFEIGPPAWIMKEINTSTIENLLSLPLSFCEAIGLREPCMITLKTSTSSTSSWQVQAKAYKCRNQLDGSGWKRFCRDNRIKVGDICKFKIIETTLWLVIIMRH